MAALRYVALNPVKAGLVARAADWPWSSAAAHILERGAPHVATAPALERVGDFEAFPTGYAPPRNPCEPTC